MKRLSTDDPLTADDVAERLDKALVRVLRIMLDVRQTEGNLLADVRKSRYLTNSINAVAYELQTDEWNVQPIPLRE